MNLNVNLIQNAEVIHGPLGRTLILAGLELINLDNLSITLDSFECIDLTKNRLTYINPSTTLYKLKTLILCDNLIEKLESLTLSFPSLEDLNLMGNKINDFRVLENLASHSALKRIYLFGNPICEHPQLREFLASRLPRLKVLDFQRLINMDCLSETKVLKTKLPRLDSKQRIKWAIENAQTIEEITYVERLLTKGELSEENFAKLYLRKIFNN